MPEKSIAFIATFNMGVRSGPLERAQVSIDPLPAAGLCAILSMTYGVLHSGDLDLLAADNAGRKRNGQMADTGRRGFHGRIHKFPQRVLDFLKPVHFTHIHASVPFHTYHLLAGPAWQAERAAARNLNPVSLMLCLSSDISNCDALYLSITLRRSAATP